MSKVGQFFRSLGNDAEHVYESLAHKLRATGGVHGGALADAIHADATSLVPSLKKAVLDAVDVAFEGKAGAHPAAALDSVAATFGEDVMKEIVARLSCRIQGLDPDAPLHASAQTAATTASGTPDRVPGTQGVDGNGSPA